MENLNNIFEHPTMIEFLCEASLRASLSNLVNCEDEGFKTYRDMYNSEVENETQHFQNENSDIGLYEPYYKAGKSIGETLDENYTMFEDALKVVAMRPELLKLLAKSNHQLLINESTYAELQALVSGSKSE